MPITVSSSSHEGAAAERERAAVARQPGVPSFKVRGGGGRVDANITLSILFWDYRVVQNCSDFYHIVATAGEKGKKTSMNGGRTRVWRANKLAAIALPSLQL